MMAAEHTIPGEELMAYLDGELSDDRAAAIQAHVAGCGACQQVVADLRGVSRDLARWTAGSPPAAPAPQLQDAPGPRRGFMTWLWPAPSWRLAAWAGAAVTLVVAVLVIPGTGPVRGRQQVATATAPASVEGEVAMRAAPEVVPNPGELAGALAPYERSAMPATGGARPPSSAPAQSATLAQGQARSSRIIRTASLTLVARDFQAVRSAVERLVQDLGGFVSTMHASEPRNDKRSLQASLRVPSERLSEALERLRQLGQVVEETQGGDDVTEQLVDLEARLTNDRNTERRLNEVPKNRTGDVSDVLEVEREIARVRAGIERLAAQQKRIEERVSFATVSLRVLEEREATLDTGTVPISRQLRNAFVEGVQSTYESIVAMALVALRVTPFVLLWAVVLWWPLRKVYRLLQGTARQQA